MTSTFPQGDLLTLAKVSAVTFNTWRNRNGLFPHTRVDRKWNTYTLAEICVARAVVILSRNGLAAQEAVDCAKQLQPFFDEVCGEKGNRLFEDSFGLFDQLGSEDGPRLRLVDRQASLHNVMVEMTGSMFVAVDLNRVCLEVTVGRHKCNRDKFSDPAALDALYDALAPEAHPDAEFNAAE